MSQRLLRVRELMKRELSTLLTRDFDFGGVLVTVNDIDVTPDFKQADVFVGILGTLAKPEEIIAKLNERHGALQNKLAKRVILKFTPRLSFHHDTSVERGTNVVSLIDRIDIPDEIRPLGENDVEV
jgi:ribosome-binding factor A